MKCCLLLASLAVFGAAAEQPMIEGNEASTVRVLIYEDLQCPDCATFRRMLDDKLLPKYKAAVAFEHRDFPLAKHSWARQAAMAARFFYEQNTETGFAFRRYALLNLKTITVENLKAKISEFAKAHGVDVAKAVASLDDARLAGLVEKDFQGGVARGVARTPTAFVNGAPFIETFTVEEISRSIDGELKK